MIDIFPDNVLLEIFDHCRVDEVISSSLLPWKWYRLAHVCRTWRDIIFASSCRLKLELLCTKGTPIRKDLSHLPALPLVIRFLSGSYDNSDEDNIIAALEHPNRVHDLKLRVSYSLLGRTAIVTEPFLALTDLCLESETDEPMPGLGETFMSGNTPHLQRILLNDIPFPEAPTLLSSACDLVGIDIHNILLPKYGYILPKEMAASLAALSRLKYLSFGFRREDSYPRRIWPPFIAPIIRAVLPSLTTFIFDGLLEYLEEFVAQIDTPQLECLKVDYLDEHEGFEFQIPQLCKFINRTEIFKKQQFRSADLCFEDYTVTLELDEGWMLRISILEEWISEILGQNFDMFSNVDRLYIFARFPGVM